MKRFIENFEILLGVLLHGTTGTNEQADGYCYSPNGGTRIWFGDRGTVQEHFEGGIRLTIFTTSHPFQKLKNTHSDSKHAKRT